MLRRKRGSSRVRVGDFQGFWSIKPAWIAAFFGFGAYRVLVANRSWFPIAVAMGAIVASSTKRRRLVDAYRFAGFRPVEHVRGVFGDPYARIITLVRRSKKQWVFAGSCGCFQGFWSIGSL